MNCFANKNDKCQLLDIKKCKVECVFFKTPEQAEEGRKKAYERIASLDIEMQKSIAENYYGDRWPWLD